MREALGPGNHAPSGPLQLPTGGRGPGALWDKALAEAGNAAAGAGAAPRGLAMARPCRL